METILTVVLIILIILLIVFGLCEISDSGYKQDQIDAINGNIKYVLIEFEDGVRDYYKESELEDLSDNYIILK